MCQVIGSENGRSCASQATVIGMYGNAMDSFLQLLKTNRKTQALCFTSWMKFSASLLFWHWYLKSATFAKVKSPSLNRKYQISTNTKDPGMHKNTQALTHIQIGLKLMTTVTVHLSRPGKDWDTDGFNMCGFVQVPHNSGREIAKDFCNLSGELNFELVKAWICTAWLPGSRSQQAVKCERVLKAMNVTGWLFFYQFIIRHKVQLHIMSMLFIKEKEGRKCLCGCVFVCPCVLVLDDLCSI